MFKIAEPFKRDKQSISRRVIKLSAKPCIPPYLVQRLPSIEEPQYAIMTAS